MFFIPSRKLYSANCVKQRHNRTFSEDERIQAQKNVKKVDEDEDDEISEPEDPMMLQRDAKDWKVRSIRSLLSCMSTDKNRAKITTPSSVSASTATRLPPNKSSAPTARRSSVTIPTRRRLPARATKTTASSSVFRKLLRSFLTPPSVVNTIPAMRTPTSSHPPRSN
jgi:hypothetical protein